MNLNEQTYRIKQMMGLLSEQKVQTYKPNTTPTNPLTIQKNNRKICETKVTKKVLENAKTWWKNWLNNPTTRQKFKAKNTNLTDENINTIFKTYQSMLDKIVNLSYINEDVENPEAVLFIRTEEPTTVNVNCVNAVDKAYQEKQILGIMVHEIQHILDTYYDFNPDESIEKDFNLQTNFNQKKGFTYQLNADKVKASYDALKKEGFYFETPSQKGGTSNVLDFYKKELEDVYKDGNGDYINSTTELRSFLSGLRNEMGKKPGEEITIQNLINQIKYNQRGNIYWFMLFVLNSGRSMTEILKDINSYAVNDNPNQPKVA